MVVANSLNQKLFTYLSDPIDFKTVATYPLFTTLVGSKFMPIDYAFICDSATAANGDGNFSIGWTGPTYEDFISGGSSTNAITANHFDNYPVSSGSKEVFPANTPIILNLTNADTGTALSIRVMMCGFYFE